MRTCPICHAPTCPPMGHSDLLIIGEFPSHNEINQGRPFALSDNPKKYLSAGNVFRKELNRHGLDFNNFRIVNLWQHEPNKNEECFKIGYESVLDEAKFKKAILLVGSEVVETFTTFKVSDVSGLQIDSYILGCPIIYAMVNPALSLHRSLGEVRLSITKFCDRLKVEGLV